MFCFSGNECSVSVEMSVLYQWRSAFFVSGDEYVCVCVCVCVSGDQCSM